jgi:hypothetical protein
MLRLRALCVPVLVAVAFAALAGGTAFAGEITGSGKWIRGSESAPLNGKSACAYSGLNDNYVLGNPIPDHDGFSRTQSWGQLDRATRAFLTSIGVNPGIACNPTRSSGGE